MWSVYQCIAQKSLVFRLFTQLSNYLHLNLIQAHFISTKRNLVYLVSHIPSAITSHSPVFGAYNFFPSVIVLLPLICAFLQSVYPSHHLTLE